MQITIRSIQPSDHLRIVQSSHRFSGRTKYQRFHTPSPNLPKRILKQLVNLDPEKEHAIVALENQEIIGVVRWVKTDNNRVELAIIVADAWQGKGLGVFLLYAIKDDAIQKGITSFSAYIQRDNRASYGVFKKVFGEPSKIDNQGSSSELVFETSNK